MEEHSAFPKGDRKRRNTVRKPLYKRVRDSIIEEIETEGLAPNSMYLSEAQAMARFEVSRVTVRQAFDLLERDGYLYRIQGRGTFIAPHTAKPAKTVAMVASCILRNGVDTILLKAIEEYLDEHDINLIVCNTETSVEKAERYVKRLVNSKIDGLIYMPVLSQVDYDKNADVLMYAINNGVPCIQLDRDISALAGQLFSVTPDNFQGAYNLVKHLISVGHRKIGFCGTFHATSVDDRFTGLLKCLEAHDLDIPEHYQIPVPEHHAYEEAVRYFMEMSDRPSVVFFVSDDPAYRFADAFQKLGYRIPEDMAIVGFDDYTMAPTMSVALTTVRVPLREEGRLAASLMRDMLEGAETFGPRPIRISTELVVRESCGAGLAAAVDA